jgi:hypothetical protein
VKWLTDVSLPVVTGKYTGDENAIVPGWGKCINLLADCSEKKSDNFSGISEVELRIE